MASLRSLNRTLRNVQAGAIDPMQVDTPPEENDNNEEELYEVDIDSFDLDTYANNYIGLARIYRLMYIADHCPRLRSDALRLAISHVITTMNANLYRVLHRKLQQCHGNILADVTGANPGRSRTSSVVGIYLRNWSHVTDYIIKAESTPNCVENPELLTTYSSTLKCMTGLAELAGRKYKLAAQNFLKANLDNWDSCGVMTPNDIAIYGGLCALATFNRSELQNKVICNNSFKLFLELEHEVREAIFKFCEAKYEVCLKMLNKIKPILLLDMYIGSHINQLYSDIRSKAMIQYLCPYDSADLRKMALSFNTSLPDLENELVQLILDGHIKARIDSINKVSLIVLDFQIFIVKKYMVYT
ncbi:COP9 signalosome complex subunit 1b-like [Acyrthosiphon pisum]|uniref:PCI domain-containing protein n=1 Tax=Acyrthosiphon pisum TaxID=7029 RepID=A0A8R2JW81_ACYPI|nr:COP9 signalosome complex subunit 1b-like [Acyrthosiphon pisum]